MTQRIVQQLFYIASIAAFIAALGFIGWLENY